MSDYESDNLKRLTDMVGSHYQTFLDEHLEFNKEHLAILTTHLMRLVDMHVNILEIYKGSLKEDQDRASDDKIFFYQNTEDAREMVEHTLELLDQLQLLGILLKLTPEGVEIMLHEEWRGKLLSEPTVEGAQKVVDEFREWQLLSRDNDQN